MSWKRSSGGTPTDSTSARWTASPTLRRYASGLPLTSEMRTRGMVGEQALDRLDHGFIHGLRALAAGLPLDVLQQAGVVEDGFVGQFHRTLRNSDRRGARIRR